MKKFSPLFACLFTLTVTAQEKLVIMGKIFDQYVVHTVTGQESIQDISNQFGQSVTKLSIYNALNASGNLPKGTQVKIPLTQYNLIHVKGDENSAPVYYIIQKGDNLYRLSKANNITVATLKEWNTLKTDIVKDGQALIIGYMVNAKMPDAKKPTDANANISEVQKAADMEAKQRAKAKPDAPTGRAPGRETG